MKTKLGKREPLISMRTQFERDWGPIEHYMEVGEIRGGPGGRIGDWRGFRFLKALSRLAGEAAGGEHVVVIALRRPNVRERKHRHSWPRYWSEWSKGVDYRVCYGCNAMQKRRARS